MKEKRKWVIAYKYFDFLEGQCLEEELKSYNVSVKNFSYQDTAFDGIFVPFRGKGVLEVREDCLEQARGIIENFEKTQRKSAKKSIHNSKRQKSNLYAKAKTLFKNKYLRSSIISVFSLSLIGIMFVAGRAYFFKIHPNPCRAKYYLELAEASIHKLDYKQAIRQLKNAIIFDSNTKVAYRRLGFAYLETGRYELAVKYYQKAVVIDPDYPGYRGLGAAYNRLGYYCNAIDVLKKAIDLDPKRKEAYLELAYSHFHTHSYNLSVTNLNEALKIDPKDYLTYDRLAANYYYLNQFEKMLEFSKKAIEISPDGFVGYFNSGLAYFKLKLYKEAIESLKKAVELNPNYAASHYYLAVIYKDMGNDAAMNEECKKLRQLGDADSADSILGIQQTEVPSDCPLGRGH